MRTIVGGKSQPIWVFAVIDVWSRLWPSTVVGKRSYRNTLDLFRDLSNRMSLEAIPLITTDAFKFYERVRLTTVRHSATLRHGNARLWASDSGLTSRRARRMISYQ